MGRRCRSSGPAERLTSRQIAELSLATLANARRLFTDAKQLYAAGRMPSSFVLLGLSADELGKHVMTTAFCVAREDTDEEWRKFWARFRRHEEKLDVTMLAVWYMDLLELGDPISGESFHKRRLGATYVDLDPMDRSIVTPESAITAELTARALAQISRLLESCELVLARRSVDQLAEVFEEARNSPKPNGKPWAALIKTVASEYGLAASDAERLAELAQGPPADGDSAPEDDSGLFAKVATIVLGIDVSASEADEMLRAVEQVKAARDGAGL